MLLCPVFIWAQGSGNNRLYVKDFEGAAGKSINMPVYLSNSDEIVAVQFDVTLPYPAKTTNNNYNAAVSLVENRTDGHVTSIKPIGGNRYTVMAVSVANKAFKGNSGILMNIAMDIAADAQPGELFNVEIENVVLCRHDGNDIATEKSSSAGFMVQKVPTPDLNISGIEPITKTLVPGEAMQLKYAIGNIGNAETGAGWSENIYVVNSDGERFFAGSVVYEYRLYAGETINRTVEVILPKTIATEGEVQLLVEVVNNSLTGEIIADRGNNSILSDKTCSLEKRLFIVSDKYRITEGDERVVFTITRSGSREYDETFAISNDIAGVMALPETVAIKAGSSGASFIAAVLENEDVNSYTTTVVNVAGANGYGDAAVKVEIVDNDDYPLTLTCDKDEYTEGEDGSVEFTVTRGGPLDDELKVNLTNSKATRFSLLRAITIPAGESTATATATIKDNLTPQQDTDVTFTATAAGYCTSKKSAMLNDNDRPVLRLALSTDMVSEDAGYGCITGTITREGDLSESISVGLDNSSDGEVYFDAMRVIIPAGSSKVTFPIGVTDNSIVSDTKVYTVWAALYLTDGKCSVGSDSPSYSSAEFTVTDNDSEYRLSIKTSAAAVIEGGEATVTVTRNDGNMQGSLTVNLAADNEMVNMPATATIPAGKSSVDFKISVPENSATDDENYFTIKATAEGYVPASVVFATTDRSLPDYNIKAVNVGNGKLLQGREFTFTTEVENRGLSELAAGMRVSIYIAEHSSIRIGLFGEVLTKNELLCYVYTPEAIPAGETKVFEYKATIPSSWFGTNYIITMADTDKEFEELTGGGNISSGAKIDVVSPFENIRLSTDKKEYIPGEIITVNGYSPTAIEGDEIEVYFYNEAGDIHTVSTKTAIDGTFTVQLVVPFSMGGSYSVGGRAIKEPIFEELCNINVCSISLNAGKYITWDITQGVPFEGEMSVRNMSAYDITDVRISLEDAPEDCLLTVDEIPVLGAGKTTVVKYSIMASNRTMSNDWVRFSVATECAQGAKVLNDVYFYCRAAKPEITFATEKINTTLMRDSKRTVDIKFTNTGSAPTGEITLQVPDGNTWMSIISPLEISSLKKGESASVSLQFIYRDGMIVDGTYESYISVHLKDGKSRTLPVAVTVVGTDEATLTVDAVDIFTKADESGNGPHVKGAKITLVNKMSGENALTGVTGEDGTWSTDVLKEGVYDLYVQAAGHKRYGETIVVGPGENIFKEVFLDYQAVTVTYTVEETEVVEEYETRLELVFVPDIPQAVLFSDEVNFGYGGTAVRNIRITNVGKLTAYNPYVEFQKIEGISFTVLSEYPDVVYPNESFEVKVQFDAPEDLIGATATAKVNYGFKLSGEMYYNSDPILLKWGKEEDMPFILGGGGLGNDDSGSGSMGEPDLNEDEDEDNDGYDPFEESPVVTYLPGVKHSQVILEFRQTFFLTRQGFNGTLTIDNAQEGRLRDIVFEANVKTMEGKDVSELFAIEYDKPEGMTIESDGSWNIEGLTTGIATVLYVPSKETAPKEAVQYLFGGKLSYTDVATGKRVSMDLMPTCLTVNPSPDLYLTYFVQREFISDDPLTDDVIEPWEPAEFALLIQNKGAGKAIDLKIETKEPQIIENVNNLPVSFHSLYSSIDGVKGNFPFKELNVGSIDAGKSVLARWFFYSNVSGYVSDYYAELTKGSMFGDEFNLITVAGAKDLTRSVRFMKRTSPAKAAATADVENRAAADYFLLDEIEDDNNLPDHIMDSQGNESADLQIVSDRIRVSGSGYTYTVSVSADDEGWVYGRLHDPTNGELLLDKVVRSSDGTELGTSNFWQSDRTMAKDRSILYENNLHFADCLEGTEEEYVLTYIERPEEPLRIDAVDGVPAGETNEPVTAVSIIFNKAVENGSFTADDISITCNGTAVDSEDIVVVAESETRFSVDWSGADNMYGTYTFTVFTIGINDANGNAGEGTATYKWNQIIDGEAMLEIEVYPANSGTATPADGKQAFGYVTLQASAADGYKFSSWTEDGTVIGKAAMMSHLLYKNTRLKANFVPQEYSVELVCDAATGSINGPVSGNYAHGTELTLYAIPNAGFRFDGWTVNGKPVGNADAKLTVGITEATRVEALFVPVVVEYIMGDINADGRVSVTDIVKMVGFIMESEQATAFEFFKGDMNSDNKMSITDIVRVSSIIVNGEVQNRGSSAVKAGEYRLSASDFESSLNMESRLGMQIIGNDCGWLGFQMDIAVPVGMEVCGVSSDAISRDCKVYVEEVANGRWRILCYSAKNVPFGAGCNMLDIILRPTIELPADKCLVELCNVMFVDAGMNEVELPSQQVCFYFGTTGIDAPQVSAAVRGGEFLTILSAERQEVAVYCLDGRVACVCEVNEGKNTFVLPAGIYIVCGNKVVITK